MKRAAVNSSSLRALGYDPDEQALEVEFHNGSLYRYEQVSADVVQALLEADSLGRYFNQVFKAQQYPYRRID
ncbi:MAG: KTSC domain-containing protein [Pseudomonadales bacterium]